MDWTMPRPMPAPLLSRRVVKKGSKIFVRVVVGYAFAVVRDLDDQAILHDM